ncbi:LamB/YcsF family protein, partial [Nocardia flavorosea]
MFGDRGYTDEGLLVARSHPDALLADPAAAAARAWEIVGTAS